MMQEVIKTFEEQVKEVDLYFKTLTKLEDPGGVLHFPLKRTYKNLKIDSDFLKILKANTFLILYNLVEASVRNGLLVLYNELTSNGHTYESVRKEIREVWIRYQYKKVFQPTATWESGRKLAARLIEEALGRAILELNENAIPTFGNLDARRIRELCSTHGISERAHQSAKGGYKLETVKAQRNALAHGDLSFSECGRQFTLKDLEEIRHQVVIYVRSILRNMKTYCEKKQYCAR